MLKYEQIEWIKRLHRDGLSQRAISRATGIARETVRRVLREQRLHPHLRDGLYDVENPVFSKPPQRCPGCGANCYMPCLACSLRKRQADQRSRRR